MEHTIDVIEWYSQELSKVEREKRILVEAMRQAIQVMAPIPPEPWPDYCSAISVLSEALRKIGEPTR